MWKSIVKSMARTIVLGLLAEAITQAKAEVDKLGGAKAEEKEAMKHGIDLLAVRVEDKL